MRTRLRSSYRLMLSFWLGIGIVALSGTLVTAQDDDGRLLNNIDIHGIISQGWLRSSDNNWLTNTDEGSFDYRQVVLNFSTTLSDDLRVGMQFAYLGLTGIDNIVVDWATADYIVNDWLNLRLGRYKIPVGQYNESRDLESMRNSIFLPQAVYPEFYRDTSFSMDGFMVHGLSDLHKLGNLNYALWIGDKDFPDNGSIAKLNEDSGLIDVTDIGIDYGWGAAIDWETPWPVLRIRASLNMLRQLWARGTVTTAGMFAFGTLPGASTETTASSFEITTYGFELSWDRLTFASEYQTQRSRFYVDVADIQRMVVPVRTEGYYGWLDYQISEKYAAGASYSIYYADKYDRDGSNYEARGLDDYLGWFKDLSIYWRININSQFALKIEHHWIDGAAAMTASENPDGFTRHWRMLILNATISF